MTENLDKLIKANEMQINKDFSSAEKIYLEILDNDSSNPDANHNLSVMLIEQNRLEDAKKHINQLLKSNYPLAQYYITAGKYFELINDLDKALNSFDKAISLSKKEEIFKAYYIKGQLLNKMNNFEESFKLFEICSKLKPNNIIVLNSYGIALTRKEKFNESIDIFKKILKINSNFFDAQVNLGLSLQKIHKYKDALEVYNKAREIKPNNFMLNINIGALHQTLRNTDEAIKYYNKAKKINPDHPEVYNNLGIIFGEAGEKEKAYKSYKKSLSLKPFNPKVFRHISQTKMMSVDDPIVKETEKIYINENIQPLDKIELAFGLGSIYENNKQYKEAFNFFSHGNNLMRKIKKYDFNNAKSKVELMLKQFPLPFERKQKSSFKPIFIIGMPRSGTTIIEGIISNNVDVDSMGELTYLSTIATGLKKNNKVWPVVINEFEKKEFDNLEVNYIDWVVETKNNVKKNFTDKMPYNFLFVGLIKSLFPDSKIIYASRDSRDNCISIFTLKLFGTHYYSNNLSDLANYYNLHLEVIDHWNKIYPNDIYKFQYENFVKDPKEETKKLFDYLGMRYEENYERFDLNNSNFRTASNYQVKEKLNLSSLGRWKNYKNELSELIDTLNEKSFINN